jgi:plasmid stabilization system protein ParE
MFDVQYNRNTFNPHLRKQWEHAHRADSVEAARAYLVATRAKFKNEFGHPSDVQYRITPVTDR